MKAIADASVLIALGAAGKLDLLRKMWKVVFIPPAVLREVQEGKPGSAEVRAALSAGWLIVESVDNDEDIKRRTGEVECLLLAKKTGASVVIMDDAVGRRVVAAAGFRTVGTVGVVLQGLKSGAVDRSEIPVMLDAWEKINFRLSDNLLGLLKV